MHFGSHRSEPECTVVLFFQLLKREDFRARAPRCCKRFPCLERVQTFMDWVKDSGAVRDGLGGVALEELVSI